MKLVTIRCVSEGVAGALLKSGEILNLSLAATQGSLEAWIPSSVRGILQAGPKGLELINQMIDRIESSSAHSRSTLKAMGVLLPANAALMSPIPHPRLLIAAGLAFHQHLKEMSGTPVPKQPTAFIKSAGSITGHECAVPIQPNAADCVDYEGELAVVFGARCHRVTPDEAYACIGGYTCANDISARDWIPGVVGAKEVWEARQTWEVNIMGKQMPGFTPLGPCLVTKDEFKDITKLRLQTRLNGKTMQSVEMSDLIFPLGETISHLSQWYAFEPGDVLLTGTPAGVGVGHKPPVFMHPGDVVEVEIDGIGVLRNTMITAI